ncbi:MAG: SIR2 family NAD-dependent protein deacylase [Bacteroidia bacterium]
MQKLVVLTGAGVSAESGISTFRDAGGLWEGHNVMDVASPQGWAKNKELVLDFYNQRRRNLKDAKPNSAHIALAELEKKYEITIITQNVDDLHERAGSKKIIHLHGELIKSRSTRHSHLVYEIIGTELNLGDKCEKGSQLRPHIVWFGDEVPEMERATEIVSQADILVIIGTSMVVYPAASLLWYAKSNIPVYYIDPAIPDYKFEKNVMHIQEKATVGMEILVKDYLKI